MDRSIEDKLIAALEAVGAPLSRTAIYSRVDDLFTTEEDLALTLGRLAASGRLHRAMRTRIGKPDEAIYSTKPLGHSTAATAEKVTKAAPAAVEKPKEEPVARNNIAGDTRQKYVDFFTKDRGWVSPRVIAAAMGLSRVSMKYHLTALEDQGFIQSQGNTSGRRYAIAGIPRTAEPAEPVRKAPAAKPKKKSKAPKARVNLGELGAPPRSLPVPAPAPSSDRITWAITDQGDVAINDGTNTIKLDPDDIAYGISFLERTQLVWMRKGA